MIMTYENIYSKLKEETEEAFTLYKVITIFRDESSWVGSGKQLMELKELVTNITGIRPGNCSGCQIEVLRNMERFVLNYERDHPEALQPVEPVREKRKRIGE